VHHLFTTSSSNYRRIINQRCTHTHSLASSTLSRSHSHIQAHTHTTTHALTQRARKQKHYKRTRTHTQHTHTHTTDEVDAIAHRRLRRARVCLPGGRAPRRQRRDGARVRRRSAVHRRRRRARQRLVRSNVEGSGQQSHLRPGRRGKRRKVRPV
jgi:hypothetical protein